MSLDSSRGVLSRLTGGVLSRLTGGVLAAMLLVSIGLASPAARAQYATTPQSTATAEPKKELSERSETIRTNKPVKNEKSTKTDVQPSSTPGPMAPVVNAVVNPGTKLASKSLALVPISENSPPSGCGCFFYRPTDKRELGPLLLHMDGNGSATLRPEGQLVAMKLIDEQHSRRNPQTISAQDRVLLKMRGGTTNASLSGMAEKNCPKNTVNNTCSSVSYQSILTIDHVGKKVSQPAWGFCGCR